MRDDRVIPAFIEQAQSGEDLEIHGDGTQTRSFCYVSDLIRGLRSLLDSDISSPINLGNPDERTIAELAGIVLDISGSDSGVVYTERPPDDPEQRRPDISKAREELEWSPAVPLRDGIRRTIETM